MDRPQGQKKVAVSESSTVLEYATNNNNTLFSARHIGGGPSTRRLHTSLYNFARNISTNISTLGQGTHLKLGELSSLFIVYNIRIF